MQKIVLMSGGFHPFHAGHAALYHSAVKNFPDAQILVGATDVQEKRPFPFAIKQALAQLAGVPKENFLSVKRQFSGLDPALVSYIKDQPDQTVLIFVRSDKDRNENPKPPERDAQGNLPLVTRGARKGLPVSNYLEYYEGNEDNLMPMTKHAYMAYLPVKEFGTGMTSATQIRNQWPTMTQDQKLELVKNMYPQVSANKKLQNQAVKLIDMGLGINNKKQDFVKSTSKDLSESTLKNIIEQLQTGKFYPSSQLVNRLGGLDKIVKILEKKLYPINNICQDYLPEQK